MNVDRVAELCHEVNRAYCTSIGDTSLVPWSEAPEAIRDSVRSGVSAHFAAAMTPEESHAVWSAYKVAEGWVYGPVKDLEAKTHPCLVPYAELPLEQRVKDFLFAAVVATTKEWWISVTP